jgi:hypothetical protein
VITTPNTPTPSHTSVLEASGLRVKLGVGDAARLCDNEPDGDSDFEAAGLRVTLATCVSRGLRVTEPRGDRVTDPSRLAVELIVSVAAGVSEGAVAIAVTGGVATSSGGPQ